MLKNIVILNIFCVLVIFVQSAVFSQEDTLFDETLALDIETTDYYDLVIWADNLGLVSSGSIDDLRNKIYSHYNLETSLENNTKQNGRSIIIESARELNYSKNILIDQNYIILEGNVILEMIDYDNNTSHKITADKIEFNQSEKTISAVGNIIYEIIRVDENEFFYGDSLVFEIDTWEGVFFEGVSQTNRLVENKELNSTENIDFFFSGKNIYRGTGDRIELNKGTITSSKSTDPYYRIDAEKIWILAPGEWAIKNAVLFVGRIPVFYFPFFFLPGDELFFNPALGYKEIEGYFLNTTTYLIGVKEETSEETFSFLKSSNDQGTLKKKYRDGLFLRDGEEIKNDELWPYYNGSFLKLFFDYYTRKGLFMGLDGNFIFDSIVKNINIFTAFSISRYLYYDTVYNTYTPLKPDESGVYVSDYEETYFFNFMIPFRFAVDLNLSMKESWGSLNIDLPVYSDTKFRSDFMNREEGIKWTELISTDQKLSDITEYDIPSLNWYANASLNPQVEFLSPVVENLNIDKFNIQLNWLSSTTDNQLPYYYPSSFIFPDISGKISGTLFESKELKSNDVISNEDFTLLKDPWSDKDKSLEINEIPGLIDIPEFMESIPVEINKTTSIFTNTLKYSINPIFSINTIFGSEIPSSGQNIDFNSDYSLLSLQTTSYIDYSFNVHDSLLNFSNISIFSSNYKEHFDSDLEDSILSSYIAQDKNTTNYKLTDNITITSKPFENKILNESIFSYSINTTLYNRYWDSVSDDFLNKYIVWNSDTITSHKASLELKIFDSTNYQTFKLDTVLPPGNIELYPEIIYLFGNFTGGLKTEFHYIKGTYSNYWLYKPYEGYLKFDFLDKDFIKQSLSIDFEDMENSYSESELFIDKANSNIIIKENLILNIDKMDLKKSSTDLQLWFLSFNYLMEDIVGYNFIVPTGWESDGESKFQPSKASAGVNYLYNPDPLWKNRLQIALNVNSSWTMNLQKYTDTAFTFDLDLSFSIAEFIELSFKSKSVNRATYRYLPGSSSEIDLPGLNIFSDLLKSFNFFNNQDRLDSNFNLESIGISVIHHLHDWDLNVEYSGEPILITEDTPPGYQWQSNFSIFVTWKPVPEINNSINYSENDIILN